MVALQRRASGGHERRTGGPWGQPFAQLGGDSRPAQGAQEAGALATPLPVGWRVGNCRRQSTTEVDAGQQHRRRCQTATRISTPEVDLMIDRLHAGSVDHQTGRHLSRAGGGNGRALPWFANLGKLLTAEAPMPPSPTLPSRSPAWETRPARFWSVENGKLHRGLDLRLVREPSGFLDPRGALSLADSQLGKANNTATNIVDFAYVARLGIDQLYFNLSSRERLIIHPWTPMDSPPSMMDLGPAVINVSLLKRPGAASPLSPRCLARQPCPDLRISRAKVVCDHRRPGFVCWGGGGGTWWF